MVKSYVKHVSTRKTPQQEQVPGKIQIANSEGGFVFEVTCWQQLDRFLTIGSEGGTYYITEQKLTRDNANSVLECAGKDPVRTVNRIVEVSEKGLAPKNDPAIFCLAMLAGYTSGNSELQMQVRRLALDAMPWVCRIGTHLFQFVEAVKAFRGWGRSLDRAVSGWYLDKEPKDLAYQMVKYQQRGSLSHRDVLRMCHVRAGNNPDLRWALGISSDERIVKRTKKDEEGKVTTFREDKYAACTEPRSEVIEAFEKAKKATHKDEIVRLIRDHRLVREAIPTNFLNDKEVWEALFEHMPMTALIRNLNKMTAIDLIKPLSKVTLEAVKKLTDMRILKKARIHPLNVLLAMRTYAKGRGDKGSLEWKPVPQITDALQEAFYMSFDTVTQTNKRWLLGIDVSSSMTSQMGTMPISFCEGATAMAMVAVRTEPAFYAHGFCHEFVDLGISKADRLDAAMKKAQLRNFGGTDCAIPMLYARQHNIPVDVFAVYTDNETHHGSVHPFQALRAYREQTGINAKLIVVGMAANKFSIADPSDAGMLDVVGFSRDVPSVMSAFVTGGEGVETSQEDSTGEE